MKSLSWQKPYASFQFCLPVDAVRFGGDKLAARSLARSFPSATLYLVCSQPARSPCSGENGSVSKNVEPRCFFFFFF